MEFNRLHFMWVFYSFVVTFLGINVLYCDNILPELLTRMYRFGKSSKRAGKKNAFVSYFEMPKRWFAHFYIFASIYFLILMLEVYRRYFTGTSTQLITWLLDHFTSRNRSSTISPECVLVLSFLLLLQALRRCYECHCVSVYSNSKMNVFHYIVGITFYFGVGLSMLSEAPGFESNAGNSIKVHFSPTWLSWSRVAGVILFFMGFVLQFHSHTALAALRKDNKGKRIVTLKHVMPIGGPFNYVSCPHFLAEIIMYVSANLIMDGRNFTWWLVCLWVVSNQIMTGLLSHQWYQKTFKDYPPKRKAVIPWLL